MNFELHKTLCLLCCCYCLFINATCEDGVTIGPKPSEFTKEMREDLGDMLATAMVDSEDYSILPALAPTDSTYWYIQTLYQQAISRIKADRESSELDRWDVERDWQVRILVDDDWQQAFVLPGGDLFITTGLLKSLRQEYELYYLLTFEAALMDGRYVLNRLIMEYDALTLSNLINRQFPANNVSFDIIANDFPNLDFDTDAVVSTDAITLNEICETSVFDKKGIVSIIENVEEADWLSTTSFDGRESILGEITVQNPERCGESRTNGSYRKYVLDRLP